MKILSRLNLKKVQSGKSALINPYSGKADETALRLTKDRPDKFFFYTLYLNKEANKLYYESNRGHLYVVELEPITSETYGFAIYHLTPKNVFESTGGDLWWVLNDTFNSVIKNKSELDKFYNEAIHAIEGMKVQSNADKLRVYEKIDEVFNSFKKD